MSVGYLLLEDWHHEWILRLKAARAQGDLEACLELRREDAEHSGLSDRILALGLAEERDWHLQQQNVAAAKEAKRLRKALERIAHGRYPRYREIAREALGEDS